MTSDPGIAAVPIRTVAPKKPGKKWERKTNYSYKMQPFASHISKPKELKKKTCASEKAKPKSKPEVHEENRFDFSNVPSPFCSCTGVARRCYKSGAGGWQSSCCTNSLSEYPLPLNPLKPGKRISGRKMSRGPGVAQSILRP